MESSRYFGGPEGAIPEYNQTHDAEVYRLMFSYGIFSDVENELVVSETDPVSLNVRVDTGWAFVHGFWYHNDSALVKSLGAADPSLDRIDRIILRLDSTTNFKISCEVKAGTPAASPSPPSLTQTDAIYEISLAQVLVEADVTSINNSKITDERSFAESKGLVSVVKLTGDQTIAGVKTFSSFPVTPSSTPSNNYEVANKKYVDDRDIAITTISSSATPTPARTSKKTLYIITALAENATFGAPTGTPQEGDLLWIRIKDNGTSRTITWNAIYANKGATLPSATTAGKEHNILLMYNSTTSKWGCVATSVEA